MNRHFKAMKTCLELVKSGVAGGAGNTNRPLTTHWVKQGVAAVKANQIIPARVAERSSVDPVMQYPATRWR